MESRISEESSVRRRRECEGCKKRFTTYERIETFQLLVIKSSGNREPYDREKLRSGIATACAKTSVSATEIEELLDELELELMSNSKREISSKQLGELLLQRLRPINEVAYVRFASVYRQFQSIDDFIGELARLKV